MWTDLRVQMFTDFLAECRGHKLGSNTGEMMTSKQEIPQLVEVSRLIAATA